MMGKRGTRRPIGSPVVTALVGTAVYLGFFGTLALAGRSSPKSAVFCEMFSFSLLASPFVALICTVYAGLVNLIGGHLRAWPFSVLLTGIFGFAAGLSTAELWQQFLFIYQRAMKAPYQDARWVDTEILIYCGVVGTVIFLVEHGVVILWQKRVKGL